MDDLLPVLGGRGTAADRPDAVTVAGRATSWAGLAASAAAVADRVAGAPAVAVEATPSLETVVAVVGGLLAGVPAVSWEEPAAARQRRQKVFNQVTVTSPR